MAIDVHSTPRIGYEPSRRRPTRDSGDDLDWLGLGRTLWRRKLFLLGFIVIVLGLTAAYVSRMPPAYEAEALVMLNDRPAQPVPNIPDVLVGTPPNEDSLQSQILLIKSRSMAERLVDQLNLQLLPEFNPALRPSTADFAAWLDPARLIPAWLLDHLPRAWADTLMTTASGAEMTDQERAALLRSQIVETVMDNVLAEPANRSTVISLKFISTDSTLAALGANTLAALYMDEQLETKQTASRRASDFLEHEIDRLRDSVSKAEQAVQDYRRKTGLGGAVPDEQQLTELTTQLVTSRAERAQSEAKLRQVERLIQTVHRSQSSGPTAGLARADRPAGPRAGSQPPESRTVARVRSAASADGQPRGPADDARRPQACGDQADRPAAARRGAGRALARGDASVQHREHQGPALAA